MAKCPICGTNRPKKDDIIVHMEHDHVDQIPDNMSTAQYIYSLQHDGRCNGLCRVCGKETPWNEKTGKPKQICGRPECKAKIAAVADARNVKIYGEPKLARVMEHQEKMLAHRSISGEYIWSDHKHKFTYTGTYEKFALEWLDKVMDFDPEEIVTPGPIVEYKLNGETKQWITDMYMPSFNLVIEIKDGGTDKNNHPGFAHNRELERAKDEHMRHQDKYNYIKITNKNMLQLVKVLSELRLQNIFGENKELKKNTKPVISVNESCKDLDTARKFVREVGELAKKYNANYFIVTDGASGTSNNGNPAVKNARDAQIKWENEHGFDPDEDWSNKNSLKESALNEAMDYINEKGDKVPKKCTKCGSKVGVFFMGEPVYKCTNKKCGKAYGVVKFKEDKKKKSLNENLELRITEPFTPKEITLYHGSPNKYKVIDCKSINVGTRLSGSRYSSYWSSNKDFIAKLIIGGSLMTNYSKKYGEPLEKVLMDKMYLKESQKNKIIPVLKSIKYYIHEATVPSKIVGKGQFISNGEFGKEYTIDVPVKVDNVEEITYNNFKSNISDIIQFVSDSEFERLKLKKKEYNANKKINAGVLDKLVYHNVDYVGKERERLINLHNIANESISSINENLELRIANPFLSKEITLYHGSIHKFNIVEPMTVNVGTRFSSPRKSSFWGMDRRVANLFAIDDLLGTARKKYNMDKINRVFDLNRLKLLVDRSRKNDVIKILSKTPVYVYEKTMPTSKVGRGHNIGLSEYTIDIPVKPDAIYELYYSDISDNIEFVPSSEINKIIEYVRSGKFKHNAPLGDRLIYHSRDSTIQRRLDIRNSVRDEDYKMIYKKMNDRISYGHGDNEPPERLLTPKELIETRKGNCWDQVELERKLLFTYTTKSYFIHGEEASTKNYATHTFIVIKDNGKYIWFENAWSSQKGLHEYTSLDKLIKDVINRWSENGKYIPYGVYEYKPPKPDISHDDFLTHCKSGKLIWRNKKVSINEAMNHINDNKSEKESLKESVLTEDTVYDSQHKYPVFIVLMHTGTDMANLIKQVTHDEFSHSCISFNSKLNPMYSFGRKQLELGDTGFVINSPQDDFFRIYYKTYYSVYVMYVTGQELQKMKKRLQYFIDNKDTLKYDQPSLLLNYFKLPSEKSKKWFCSRFVAEILNAGIELDKLPSLYKPQDFVDINNISLVSKGYDFYKYNYRDTDRVLQSIRNGTYKPLDENFGLVNGYTISNNDIDILCEQISNENGTMSIANLSPITTNGIFIDKEKEDMKKKRHGVIEEKLIGENTKPLNEELDLLEDTLSDIEPFLASNGNEEYEVKDNVITLLKPLVNVEYFIEHLLQIGYTNKTDDNDNTKFTLVSTHGTTVKYDANTKTIVINTDDSASDIMYDYMTDKIHKEILSEGAYRVNVVNGLYQDISLLDSDRYKNIPAPKLDLNKLYITSDLHLCTKKQCVDINEFIKKVNKKVKSDDQLLLLGDIVDMPKDNPNKRTLLSNTKYMLDKLNCKNIYLILGNNDVLPVSTYYKCGYKYVSNSLSFDKYIFTHFPVPVSKDEINFHGHIHQMTTLRNIDPNNHINVWWAEYNDILSFNDYMKEFKNGRYKNMTRVDFDFSTMSEEGVMFGDGIRSSLVDVFNTEFYDGTEDADSMFSPNNTFPVPNAIRNRDNYVDTDTIHSSEDITEIDLPKGTEQLNEDDVDNEQYDGMWSGATSIIADNVRSSNFSD